MINRYNLGLRLGKVESPGQFSSQGERDGKLMMPPKVPSVLNALVGLHVEAGTRLRVGVVVVTRHPYDGEQAAEHVHQLADSCL